MGKTAQYHGLDIKKQSITKEKCENTQLFWKILTSWENKNFVYESPALKNNIYYLLTIFICIISIYIHLFIYFNLI